jgi:hypothetical protein
MSIDERADERAGAPSLPTSEATPGGSLTVVPAAHGDRPIAPADPRGHELLEDLKARVAELDAIAWNLPVRRTALLAPPDRFWPAPD